MIVGGGEVIGVHIHQIPLPVVELDIIPGMTGNFFRAAGNVEGLNAKFFTQDLESAGIAFAHGLISVTGDNGAVSGVRCQIGKGYGVAVLFVSGGLLAIFDVL